VQNRNGRTIVQSFCGRIRSGSEQQRLPGVAPPHRAIGCRISSSGSWHIRRDPLRLVSGEHAGVPLMHTMTQVASFYSLATSQHLSN
jgi:hypothetical protein